MKKPHLVVLRLGLGRDSLAMLCLLVSQGLTAGGRHLEAVDVDAVVFTDTGAEWQSTYRLIPRVRAFCAEHGLRFLVQRKPNPLYAAQYAAMCKSEGSILPDKPWRRSDPGTVEGRCRSGFYHHRIAIMSDYESRDTIVRFADGGSCTSNHKVAPMRAMLADLAAEKWPRLATVASGPNKGKPSNHSWGAAIRRGEALPHELLLGIAADEAQRVLEDGGPSYERSLYPLVEMGVTKADEADILEAFGFNDVHKSGCTMCKFAPLAWFWVLSVMEPQSFRRVAEYEANALDNGKVSGNRQYLFPRTKGSDGQPMRIREAVLAWRKANPTATVESVMQKDYKRCDRGGRPVPGSRRRAS